MITLQLQAAAETHIVTLVGPGEAPEWGCDAVWAGGAPVLENCTAVFGVMYRLGEPDTAPAYLEAAIKKAPRVAGASVPYPADQLDLMSILPSDLSYYSYIGSLVRPFHARGSMVMNAAAPCMCARRQTRHSFLRCTGRCQWSRCLTQLQHTASLESRLVMANFKVSP